MLRGFGIRTVIDLRSGSELERAGSTWRRTRWRSITSPSSTSSPTPRTSTAGPGLLGSQYLEIVRDAGGQILAALEVLASPDALPAVFHCTAGKDRTGVLSAIVLSLLGVDEPTVVADYALSGEAMLRLRAKLIQKYPEGRETLENIDEVFSAEPAQMEQLLDHIQEQYGSVGAYVEGLGAPPGLLERLRTALLEPAGLGPPPSSSRTSGRKRSTTPASARSRSVSPPESCVVRTRRTVFHRMSMSG